MVSAADQMEYILSNSNTSSGDWGVRQLTKIFNAIMQSGKMPDEWRESTITPIYKDKGDHKVMNCSNYRGIKLLSHTMKLWEHIIDQRLRDIVSISDGQFAFKPGVGTMDAIGPTCRQDPV